MSEAGAGSVAVNFPALPEYEKRVSTTGPSTGLDTKTEKLSPVQEEKLGAVAEVTKEQIAATDPVRRLREREAEIGMQDAELQRFAGDAQEQLRTGPEAQAAKAYVDWARHRTQQEESRLAAMPPPRFFKSGDG